MISLPNTLALLASLSLCAASCGARTAWSNDPCQGPQWLVTPFDGTEAILAEGRCSFETVQDGHRHRVVCDGESCLWTVDGTLTCTCEHLDNANTCGNGIPLCADWLLHFDFSGGTSSDFP